MLHVLAATVWTGGHLLLSVRYLPDAWARRDASEMLQFEQKYEAIGMPALLIQVLTGLYMAWQYSPHPMQWFDPAQPLLFVFGCKWGLLLITVLLAMNVRFRLLPHMSSDKVRYLCAHVFVVTIISIMFVILGVSVRFGGWAALM